MSIFKASALPIALAAFAALPALAEDAEREPQGRAVVVGEVIDSRGFVISGTEGTEHKMLKVRTGEGKTLVINIGEQTREVAQVAQLEAGDLVMAVGNKGRINGQPVLFARYFGPTYAGGRNTPEQD